MQDIYKNKQTTNLSKELTALIIFESLPIYRIEFYNLLQEKLKSDNITLKLIFGGAAPTVEERPGLRIKSAIFKTNRVIKIGPIKLVWQPCMKEIKTADVVIVQQASKLLINYILLFRRMLGKQTFAFWGHGHNMQSRSYNVLNIFKRLYSNYADWWFAYTEGVKYFLIQNGYKEKQITVVQNAINTKKLLEDYNSMTEKELSDIRNMYNIEPEDKVLIYCGRLYKEKRIPFLIEAADRLEKELGYVFKLIVIGAGPDEVILKSATKGRPWLIVPGPRYGRQKAAFFKLADIFLFPGAIGLGVLDSFALETPIVTTKYPYHGPEYEYLINGYNGLVTENNMKEYVETVLALINNKEQLNTLKRNCITSAQKYSIENMVTNFAEGVKKIIYTKQII